MSNYHNEYHAKWQNHRIDYLARKLGVGFFKDKTLLELGPYNGYIGNWFHEQGAIVTCIEGRKENCEHIRQHFPHLNVIEANLDSPDWPYGHYDIIVNMGLIYHLEKFPEENVRHCISNCHHLILETTIVEGTASFIQPAKEHGKDQSLSDMGGDPSPQWVERILSGSNCTFERVKDMSDSGGWKYGSYSGSPRYNRGMWIVTTNAQI